MGRGALGAGSVEAGERPPSTPSPGQGAVGFWSLFLRSQTLHWAPSPRLEPDSCPTRMAGAWHCPPALLGAPMLHRLSSMPLDPPGLTLPREAVTQDWLGPLRGEGAPFSACPSPSPYTS